MADARARLVARAYQTRIVGLRARVDAIVERSWRSLSEIHEPEVRQFAATVAPLVTAAQANVGALTVAYLRQIETITVGAPAAPVTIPAGLLTDEQIRGVPAADVFFRPGVTVWTALAAGVGFVDARERGLARARSLAATDIQLAKTHSARFALSRNGRVSGYRRVLEGGKPCDLCIAAAADTYSSSDLLPIHPHCDCGVEPIFDAGTPGNLDPPDVDLDAEDPETDVVVHDHGELGPVLGFAGQTFTSAADL